MVSWGLYDGWDPNSRKLPTIREFTTDVPAYVGVEFGFIVKIHKARGHTIYWSIEHPPFLGADGKPAPTFEDKLFIRDNGYEFFLGDTLWEPIADKCGPWRLTIRHKDAIVADKTFKVGPQVV